MQIFLNLGTGSVNIVRLKLNVLFVDASSIVSNFNMVAIPKQQIELNAPGKPETTRSLQTVWTQIRTTEYRSDLDPKPLVAPYQCMI